MRECSPPQTCHVSHVTCHVSRVTCHVSHVRCHMSHFFFDFFFLNFYFYLFIFFRTLWLSLSVEGLSSTGLPRLVSEAFLCQTHTARRRGIKSKKYIVYLAAFGKTDNTAVPRSSILTGFRLIFKHTLSCF